MNRLEFMLALRRGLVSLPSEEIENAVRYYCEYFDDAGEENEQRAMSELGSPEEIAKQILADYAGREPGNIPYAMNYPTGPSPKKQNSIWFIVSMILLFPIWLPLAIVAIALVFALLVIFGALVFSILVTIAALIFGGLVALIAGLSVIPQDFSTALFFTGVGLATAGIGLLLISPAVFLSIKCCKAIGIGFRKFFEKARNRKNTGGENQ